MYRIAGKVSGGMFGEFGESSVIRQTKTIQLSILTIYDLLADLLIHQTILPNPQKESIRQTLPLYGNSK